MLEISRRDLLAGSAAAAAAIALPSIAAASPVGVIAAAPAPAWAVGTPGEWDYRHIVALTEREARLAWLEDYSGDAKCESGAEPDTDPECDCDACYAFRAIDADRQEIWDGKEKLTTADWLHADMGANCSRCGYETCKEENGHPVGDEAVCFECMTLADWDIVDPKRAAELRTEAAE